MHLGIQLLVALAMYTSYYTATHLISIVGTSVGSRVFTGDNHNSKLQPLDPASAPATGLNGITAYGHGVSIAGVWYS